MIISHTCFITSTFQDVVDWCDDVDAINLLSIKLQHWHIPLWWTSVFIHLTVEPCCHTRATLCHTEFTISWRKGYLDLFEFPAICLAFHSLSLRALPSLSQPSDLLGKGNPPKSCQGFMHDSVCGSYSSPVPRRIPSLNQEEGNRQLPRDKVLRERLSKQACSSRQDPCTSLDTSTTTSTAHYYKSTC